MDDLTRSILQNEFECIDIGAAFSALPQTGLTSEVWRIGLPGSNDLCAALATQLRSNKYQRASFKTTPAIPLRLLCVRCFQVSAAFAHRPTPTKELMTVSMCFLVRLTGWLDSPTRGGHGSGVGGRVAMCPHGR
ncbi:hypothetical protein LSAT2_016371 [Lamellibrachia satsuma]|nr:hypothetical protein LSAT2_016371 [Lamellibrachia satsuma]